MPTLVCANTPSELCLPTSPVHIYYMCQEIWKLITTTFGWLEPLLQHILTAKKLVLENAAQTIDFNVIFTFICSVGLFCKTKVSTNPPNAWNTAVSCQQIHIQCFLVKHAQLVCRQVASFQNISRQLPLCRPFPYSGRVPQSLHMNQILGLIMLKL